MDEINVFVTRSIGDIEYFDIMFEFGKSGNITKSLLWSYT